MPVNVAMPKLGMTMVEGTVRRWLSGEGQQVEKGAPVMEIETEKIVYEIGAPVSGFLHIICQEEGVVPCGGTCGIVAVTQDDYQSLLAGGTIPASQLASSVDRSPKEEGAPSSVISDAGDRVKASPAARKLAQELRVDIGGVTGTGPAGRIVEDDVRASAVGREAAVEPERMAISPLARKLAEENGIDFGKVAGSGPGGRIVREDILAAIERQTTPCPEPLSPMPEGPSAATPDQRRVAKTIPLSGIRKAVAERMMGSIQNSAQLTFIMDVDATELVSLRQQLVADAERIGARISYNDLIIRATIRALGDFPIFNSAIEGDSIAIFENVNIGVAMAIDNGLIVPVVHDADRLSIVDLNRAIAGLAEKAHSRTLSLGDITGGTFTLTNLGAYDVLAFTPIINPPESAILGVGGIAERPAVVNGQVAVRSLMYLSLTCDHRIADGVPASQFLRTIKQFLERPSSLLV